MNKYIIAILMLLAPLTIEAATCKQMLGNWNINYSINGNPYTDQFQITGVKGTNLIAFNRRTGAQVDAWCRAGVVMIDDGDSDYVVQHYYFWTGNARILNVIANDSISGEEFLLSIPLNGVAVKTLNTKSTQSVEQPNFDKINDLKAILTQ